MSNKYVLSFHIQCMYQYWFHATLWGFTQFSKSSLALRLYISHVLYFTHMQLWLLHSSYTVPCRYTVQLDNCRCMSIAKNAEGSHDNHHLSCNYWSSAVNFMSCWQLSCQFMFRVVTHEHIYVHTVYVRSYDKLHLQSIWYALGCTTYQDGVETGPIWCIWMH